MVCRLQQLQTIAMTFGSKVKIKYRECVIRICFNTCAYIVFFCKIIANMSFESNVKVEIKKCVVVGSAYFIH